MKTKNMTMLISFFVMLFTVDCLGMNKRRNFSRKNISL